jgi:DNA repair protein RadC
MPQVDGLTTDQLEFLKWTKQFEEEPDLDGMYQEHLKRDNVIAEAEGFQVKFREVYVSYTNPAPLYNADFQIRSASQIGLYAKLFVQKFLETHDNVEHFFAFMLNNANIPIGIHHVFKGQVDKVTISPAPILRSAVICAAKSLIIVHNHPSGNLQPSPDDIAVTRMIGSASKSLQIDVLDHIIVSLNNNDYYSFSENNLPLS